MGSELETKKTKEIKEMKIILLPFELEVIKYLPVAGGSYREEVSPMHTYFIIKIYKKLRLKK
jgi:hypothetical protein